MSDGEYFSLIRIAEASGMTIQALLAYLKQVGFARVREQAFEEDAVFFGEDPIPDPAWHPLRRPGFLFIRRDDLSLFPDGFDVCYVAKVFGDTESSRKRVVRVDELLLHRADLPALGLREPSTEPASQPPIGLALQWKEDAFLRANALWSQDPDEWANPKGGPNTEALAASLREGRDGYPPIHKGHDTIRNALNKMRNRFTRRP